MKRLCFALIYTAAMALANPGVADVAAAQEAATGAMRKLVFHTEPKPAGQSGFETFEGAPLSLSDWQGKWVLVNFWATWCAPCKKEMPMLSELQDELGGDRFEVLTIATTRNPPQAMKSFFDDYGLNNLPLHKDPGSKLSREMAVLGLPTTLILDPEGQEIARMRGDADWASDEAKAMLRALMGE